MDGFCGGASHQVRSKHRRRPITWTDRLIGAINDWPNQSVKLKALTIAASSLQSDYFNDCCPQNRHQNKNTEGFEAMRDYLAATTEFDYQHTVDAALAGNLQALNACVECCDRHALPGRIALFWEGKDGQSAT
jgi:hypothetical protein